jgi:hypothetical protein
MGTDVAVITDQRRRTHTGPSRTGIRRRTGILIVAVDCIRLVNTTLDGIATIIGTGITIVAKGPRAAQATAVIALITLRTRISIITRCLIRRSDTPFYGVTAVVGTDLAVITHHWIGIAACAISTQVSGCTRIAVIAIGRIGHKRTAFLSTTVIGA